MIEINLVPDVKQELIKAQRIRSTVIAASVLIGSISVAVVALLTMYIFTVQAVRGGLVDNAIKQGSDKLASVEDLSKVLTIQNQLTKISDLNSNKHIYSRIFDLLSSIIPPSPNDIQISNLKIDSTTELITIEGQASNSYAAVEVFKKTIEGAKVRYTDSNNKTQEVTLASSISTSNTSYGEDSSGAKVLRFTISFVYAPELFSVASKNASVIITTKGNATDSYIDIPKSIFVDRAKDLTEGQ
jgi:Tfp pilus assembly protein PilN